MNRDEIKQYLPHREPMLLVDEMTLDENHVAHSKYYALIGHISIARQKLKVLEYCFCLFVSLEVRHQV